ncbi:MAG: hypothetical protein CMB32_05350 [Euryarchaeota archaeon]|nr:hypothetical protein [Euryarchaeota archaeon]|tara:strand:- start:24 stop:572 length:549 start_codon:yes stop_codon:yes gene_type:complete
MRTLLLIAVLGFSSMAISQEIEADEKTDLTESQIRVKKTTRWAAVLPGAGQVINKKYWKVPLVYASMGISIYMIKYNTDLMNEFKQAWIFETDDDPLTVSELTDSNGFLYTVSDLENGTYVYRRNRDLSYLSLVGFYLLQIIDANVDAHLRFFDTSEDLSFSLFPPRSYSDVWQVGLKLNLK